MSNVNVPNRGQCPDLPLGAVVETNALFGLDRIQPVYAGNMPKGVLPLVTRHVQNQENALRAILDGDRSLRRCRSLRGDNSHIRSRGCRVRNTEVFRSW